MIKDRCQAVARSKWFLLLFCLGLGVVVLVASWLGGQLGAGMYGLVVMAGFDLVLLLLTGRSETIRGLTVGRDERFAQIDLRATAIAGLAVITAVIVAWLVETAPVLARTPASGAAAEPADYVVAANADFHAGGSGQLSGEFVADGAALPPGDGGGGREVC